MLRVGILQNRERTLRNKPFLRAAACALLLPALPALAASPRSVDVQTLDVAGVRTGMDYDQVAKALADHFQAAPADLKPDPFPGENIVTHTRLPSTLTYEKDGTRVTVHFEGRVPVDPARPLVAWLVTYQVPWTPANAEGMAKAALARYGTPSNAPNTLPMQWCARPSANTGIGCPGDDARLDLSQVQLTLTDPAWQRARIRFIQGQQTVQPRL